MENKKLKYKNAMQLTLKMINYNFRVIFAGRFIWFFMAALAFYIFIAVNAVYNGEIPDEDFVYSTILFPAILLIFYPTSFGIQNDADAGILEILFGIPDYRYKVWVFRLIMVFIIVFLLLLVFAELSNIFLIKIGLFEMAYQVMYPVFFIGCLGFMFSTVIKNGNGTAVVMIILGAAAFILSSVLEETMWDVFLNPFNAPDDMNEMIWESITMNNRIFLIVGGIVASLYGLFNMQKREKFI